MCIRDRNALAAPARTPRAVVLRLNRDVQAVLGQPDVRRKLHELHVEAAGGSPEAAADLLAADIRRWGDVIQRAKIPRQ